MQCHRCVYNGKGSEMCLACTDTISTPQNAGRSFVSVEGAGDLVSLGVRPLEGGGGLGVSPCCEDAVRRLLGVVMSLDEGELSLFRGVMMGESLRGYARRVGIGKSTACKMLRVMMDGHPELGFLRGMVSHHG